MTAKTRVMKVNIRLAPSLAASLLMLVVLTLFIVQEFKEISRSQADEAIDLTPNERNILVWKGLVKVPSCKPLLSGPAYAIVCSIPLVKSNKAQQLGVQGRNLLLLLRHNTAGSIRSCRAAGASRLSIRGAHL